MTKWILSLLVSQQVFPAIPKVNILVGKNLKKLSVSGSNIKRTYVNRKNEKLYKGSNTLTFDCTRKGSLNSDNLLVYLQSDDQILKWGEKSFLGNFIISSEKNKKSCNMIMQMSLEKYVSLILTKEMSASWPKEALKAQAVAARSYALYKIKNNKQAHAQFFHLENSEKHQVHGSLDDENSNSKRATAETKGEILIGPNQEIQEIFYHAHCGGKTKKPEDVWGGKVAGYQSVDCPYCYNHPRSKWQKSIKISKIQKTLKKLSKNWNHFLGVGHSNLYASTSKFFDSSYQSQELSKSKMRSRLGRSFLPSAHFTIENHGHNLVINGRGNGHSVGMCQLGALEMAKRGFSYKKILSHYFPNHKIVKIK